jgi:hypothetical protein
MFQFNQISFCLMMGTRSFHYLQLWLVYDFTNNYAPNFVFQATVL